MNHIPVEWLLIPRTNFFNIQRISLLKAVPPDSGVSGNPHFAEGISIKTRHFRKLGNQGVQMKIWKRKYQGSIIYGLFNDLNAYIYSQLQKLVKIYKSISVEDKGLKNNSNKLFKRRIYKFLIWAEIF